MKEKIVLGMSGGVDSSVAAFLLNKEGYEVTGITMTLVPRGSLYNEDRGCCSISSVNEAKIVANNLGINHYVMNFRREFDKKVIDNFVEEYSKGRTPNPCIVCNKYIKFESFRKKAHGLDIKYISTGHYAKNEYDEKLGRYVLKKAKDKSKDQTYFLYNMSQEALSETVFPLGDLTKDEVREIAKENNIASYSKPDSEEICFVHDNDHGRFIKARNPEKVGLGNFIDDEGNILGKHKGIVNYTLGQRKGLGIALGKRVFVSKINGDTNEVTLSDEDKLFKKEINIKDINIIPYEKLEEPMEVTVKVRHGMREHKALATQIGEDEILIQFEEAVRAPVKGQSAVMYSGDLVIGGGIIDKVEGE